MQFESLKEEIQENDIDDLIESVTNLNQIKKAFQILEPKHPEYQLYKKAITSDFLYNLLKDNLNPHCSKGLKLRLKKIILL